MLFYIHPEQLLNGLLLKQKKNEVVIMRTISELIRLVLNEICIDENHLPYYLVDSFCCYCIHCVDNVTSRDEGYYFDSPCLDECYTRNSADFKYGMGTRSSLNLNVNFLEMLNMGAEV